MKINNKKERETDRIAKEVSLWQKKNLSFIKKSRIRTWKVVAIVAFIIGVTATTTWLIYLRIQQQSGAFTKSPLMSILKTRGCVADGILSGYGGDTDYLIDMINRSECQYLHRSVETWAAPPDFDQVAANMKKINKKGIIYGMFLAEAINPNATYFDGKTTFHFNNMCQKGSVGFWGENTCQANLNNREYRAYLKSITHRAIDLGVQSFLFGQIYFQDPKKKTSTISDVLDDMRDYAASKGKAIVIGAQTNDIDDSKYLQLFDYIEGGVGINARGEIEDGPCFSRWWKKEGDRCWALLWHKEFSSRANDVLLHLDWSGFDWDDMSTFDQMDKKTRIKTLDNLYTTFTTRDMGFMMPFLAVINDSINGCQGPQKNFYAPGNKYTCKDEDDINDILKKGTIATENISMAGETSPSGNVVQVQNNILAGTVISDQSNMLAGTAPKALSGNDDAQFISQVIPIEMTVGYRYQISITMKNTGNNVWNRDGGYLLKAMGTSSGFIPEEAELGSNDAVAPGQTKTFAFDIFAPKTVGKYDISWIMAQKNIGTFGDPTQNISVIVNPE